MAYLEVRPSDDDIAASRVSLWEKDYNDHSTADPRWGEDGYGGAYITGDPKNPGKTYVVADTPGVRQAIKANRLVLISSNAQPVQPAPIVAAAVTPAPTPEPVVTPPTPSEPIQQSDTPPQTPADSTDSTADAQPSGGSKKGK